MLPTLISLELGLGMFFGYIVARLVAGPQANHRGILPSLILSINRYRIHLHHWLLFLCLLLSSLLFHFFIFTPKIFYGFLSGVIVQGIISYEDWRKIVKTNDLGE